MSAGLFAWYDTHGRDLPWRSSRDPWHILVSEVMSQQTQIGRVAERFPAFLERFPTPSAMAQATPVEVLTAWSGLGYNRRALRLREAAAEISRCGWPTTALELESLPGIGPYTAAAVACFAFGEQVPTVDTNLKRVLSRWAGEPLDGRALRDAATAALPEGDAIRWNQAMMDLAALICRPTPDCEACPVTADCRDPSVYEAPARQGPFEGSVRQARGAALRALVGGPARLEELAIATGVDVERLQTAVARLERDGTVHLRPDGAWAVVS